MLIIMNTDREMERLQPKSLQETKFGCFLPLLPGLRISFGIHYSWQDLSRLDGSASQPEQRSFLWNLYLNEADTKYALSSYCCKNLLKVINTNNKIRSALSYLTEGWRQIDQKRILRDVSSLKLVPEEIPKRNHGDLQENVFTALQDTHQFN